MRSFRAGRADLVFPQAWDAFLGHPFEKPPHEGTLRKALAAYEAGTVYPPQERLFAAFAETSPEQLRVVILGQDPYHEAVPGNCQLSTVHCPLLPQANGLAFSVSPGVPLPPSLRNIFTELASDLGQKRTNGDLSDWAAQGVLLLNTVLTVEAGKANSHRDLGWQAFTDAVIGSLRDLPQPIAFVLWGAQAQKKRPLLKSEHPRLVLESPHPSPLSSYRGFFGSRPFSQINAFLAAHGEAEIIWS